MIVSRAPGEPVQMTAGPAVVLHLGEADAHRAGELVRLVLDTAAAAGITVSGAAVPVVL